MRQKTKLSKGINVICPVQSLLQKYSDFQKTQISAISSTVHPTEGRIASVTDAGLDAVDARRCADEALLFADGEVVWS